MMFLIMKKKVKTELYNIKGNNCKFIMKVTFQFKNEEKYNDKI